INNTLEAWNDVNLEISTATFKPVRITEPTPWYISERLPPPPPSPSYMTMAAERRAPMASRKLMKKAKVAEKEYIDDLVEEEAYEEPIKEMAIETAEMSQNAFGVQQFKIPKKYTIKDDGNPHPILLQEFEVTSKRLFYWNSVDQQVIAQEKIKNADITLLPGRVKCYVDGDFVGETSIKVISPGEEFKIGTRLSYDLKIEKKLIKRDIGKKGLTKGKLINEYEYEIKIKNFRKQESELTIIDRLPCSRHQDIEVEPSEKHLEDYFSLVPKKYNLNIATWELKLQPEQELKIKYRFSVQYKKDLEIEPPLP
ncbi:MAG: DUF4139 domain-containing protein, partial [Candidatus Helarchaeales archaeon]